MPGAPRPPWDALLEDQVRESGRMCYRVAYRIVRSEAAAEDACQQAYAKAWQHRDKIRDAASLRGWLVRTVVNEGLQLLRRRRTEASALADRPVPLDQGPPDEGAAMRESVVLALEALLETIRTVVVLRLMDGRSGNEVKELLGCSASEVSRRLHEGMAMLRVSLAEWTRAGAR